MLFIAEVGDLGAERSPLKHKISSSKVQWVSSELERSPFKPETPR